MKKNDIPLLAHATITYVAFFSLLAFTVWLTESGWCLWALLLAPSYSSKRKGEKKEEE